MKKILFVILITMLCAVPSQAAKSIGEMLDERTATLWADAQFLGDMVLNARARVTFTWLPRSMTSRNDDIVRSAKWAADALARYYSSEKKMKGRDVIAVNWETVKSWTFDPTSIVVNGFRITSDDILGDARDIVVGYVDSGSDGTLQIAVPSMKGGSVMHIEMGSDSTEITLPKR